MFAKCLSRLACILLLAGLSSWQVRADFDAGLKAYNAGDFATALKEWQPLAEQGAPHAQYNMGLLYARGQGVPQDFAKAADFYQKAAEQGIVEAQYNLGVLYGNGQGVKKDEAEASKWFLKAAQQGDLNAANSLGNIYDEGPGGFQNFSEAEKWYRKAADSGIAIAQFNLGAMYDIGQGVKQDYAEALKWYQKAADQGNSAALCNIGILYYNGQGVPLDRTQAHRYFLIASELGEPRAADLIKFTTEKLNKKQLAQAVTLADQWRQAHPGKVDTSLAPPPPAILASADTQPAAEKRSPQTPEARMATGSAALQMAADFKPADQSVWTGVARVVAVGDVLGDYEQLVTVLKSAGIIDDSTNWTGGKTHLVQTGAILDRGGRSRDVMDLLIKLQRQAQAAGGYVHCLLGNHEVMNLYGDLRYVSPGEYAAFTTPASGALRDREFAKAANSGVNKDDWYKQHPLGYFEHLAAFGPDGYYGRWLRSLNTEIRIDDTLFVFSGISAKYVAMSMDEMNRRVRDELNNPGKLQGGIVTDQEGPFWYRGLTRGDPKMVNTIVDATLENTGAKREAFGHSYAEAAITPRLNGKLIMLDIGLPRVYDNISKIGCLLIEDGKAYALHRGHKLELPLDDKGPAMLQYLKQAAAFDPAPSPLLGRIQKLEHAPPTP
ncbi:MAG: metallophosphoesterase [Terriglobia bacterium]